ncbi:hypothetical protein PYCCODRAFT_651840 [Trametes coccinea BRFM310]|uniref:Uncharacterized protein n=1 Tax=Trametes coccinea (strain BRFM310) TaxID=1353009 RepID=A0A1Y2IHQ1_TRAC3|nr:hypothetical protein PYCCODRAFT_651840 [Trametes coccinea BRFM310]
MQKMLVELMCIYSQVRRPLYTHRPQQSLRLNNRGANPIPEAIADIPRVAAHEPHCAPHRRRYCKHFQDQHGTVCHLKSLDDGCHVQSSLKIPRCQSLSSETLPFAVSDLAIGATSHRRDAPLGHGARSLTSNMIRRCKLYSRIWNTYVPGRTPLEGKLHAPPSVHHSAL